MLAGFLFGPWLHLAVVWPEKRASFLLFWQFAFSQKIALVKNNFWMVCQKNHFSISFLISLKFFFQRNNPLHMGASLPCTLSNFSYSKIDQSCSLEKIYICYQLPKKFRKILIHIFPLTFFFPLFWYFHNSAKFWVRLVLLICNHEPVNVSMFRRSRFI